MKKEIPILFSTPMVKAIIAGSKTMTRRIIKPQPHSDDNPGIVPRILGNEDDWGKWYWDTEEAERIVKHCPYGNPSDILWVRESFSKWSIGGGGGIYYRADYPDDHIEKWKPSIHMPKDYSRIWLQATDVRVERLLDISPSDACDEGVEYENIDAEAFEGGELQADFKNYDWKDDPSYEDYHFPFYANPVSSFFSLWKSINGKKSLESNPWVWVISFKVLSTKGKPDFNRAKNYDFNCRTNLQTSHF
jgi:hypothetical protein